MKIKLEIEEKEREYDLVVNWDEVTVSQYSQIVKAQQQDLNEIQLSVRLVSVLSGMHEDIIYSMDMEQLKEIIQHIKFVNEPLETKQVEYITINDEKYFLKKEFEKLTVGEMISLQMIEEEMRKDSVNNIYAYLPKFLCLFLRKEGEMDKFENHYMEREQMFGDVKIVEANDLFAFFLVGEKQ